jgi:hypothetical protein
MTKTTNKAKTSHKESTVPSALIVLGFDDKQKPRGARFEGAKPDLVAKAAQAMDLRVYEAKSSELAELAEKLPVGRLYATGKGFVPNIRQNLYSQILVALAGEPGAAVGDESETPPVASGLPKNWDDITPGHLVVAQESLENGWWECLVLAREGDMLTLRFKDYPKLPKFSRHRAAVALVAPAI